MKDGVLIDRSQVQFRVNHPGTVCGILMRPDGCLLLVHVEREEESLTWEVPGGVIEHGETRDVALRREFIEETGFLPVEFSVVHSFTTAVGLTNEIVTLYQIDDWSQESIHAEHETQWADPDAIANLIAKKLIVDCKTIIACLYLQTQAKKQ